MTSVSVFQDGWQSSWLHPGIAWIAGVPLLAVGVWAWLQGRRSRDTDPRRNAWLAGFFVLQLAIMLDAWLTGGLTPFARGGRAATVVAIGFVILGDLRFFYLVERQRGLAAASGKATLRALALALPVSLIVPAATAALHHLDAKRWSGNLLYFVYELGLFALAFIFASLRTTKMRDGADRRGRYVSRLAVFECTQYGLWVAADALILGGIAGGVGGGDTAEVGWLLRILPNALYYAGFVPVATWATPSGSRV